MERVTCTRCGEEFSPTIVLGLSVETGPDTCPAAGGGGHWARREQQPSSERGTAALLAVTLLVGLACVAYVVGMLALIVTHEAGGAL